MVGLSAMKSSSQARSLKGSSPLQKLLSDSLRRLMVSVAVTVQVACSGATDGSETPAETTGTMEPTQFTVEPEVTPSSLPDCSSTPSPESTSEVSGELCDVEGPELSGDRYIDELMSDSDGNLYLIDPDGNMRRYLVSEEEQCSLSLDKSFGIDGIISNPESPIISAALTGQNTAFIGTLSGKVMPLLSEENAPNCNVLASSLAAADEATLFAAWGGTFSRLVLENGECRQEDWKDRTGLQVIHVVRVIEGELYVAGTETNNGPERVIRIGLNGNIKQRYGSLDPCAEDFFCYVNDVRACPHGICVLDSNCRKLFTYTLDGQLLSSIDLFSALGDSSLFPVSSTFDQDGTAYFSAQIHPSPETSLGAVFRLPLAY